MEHEGRTYESNGWYVFVKGRGDYGDYWGVIFQAGDTPADALESALHPSATGWGKEGDIAAVVHEDDIHKFTIHREERFVAVAGASIE